MQRYDHFHISTFGDDVVWEGRTRVRGAASGRDRGKEEGDVRTSTHACMHSHRGRETERRGGEGGGRETRETQCVPQEGHNLPYVSMVGYALTILTMVGA